MKPLILILLAAVWASAQNPTIADIARQERARRAQGKSTRVYTIENTRSAEPAAAEPEKAPQQAVAPAAKPAEAGTPAGTAAAPTGPDPVKQWLDETGKIRDEIRDLMEQETKTQLEINTITNRLYAPVTSQSDKDKAATELRAATQKLIDIRVKLDKNRKDLQAREAQGPPKK